MIARLASCFFLLFIFSATRSQVVSGPMLGQVELRDARIWIEVTPAVKSIKLTYNKKGNAAAQKSITYKGELGREFNPIQFHLGGLEMNTTYDYSFVIDDKPAKQKGSFTTKELWQWRKPAPDFNFITGSCAYFNEPIFDRPGKPYGGDSSIFETMAREKAAFMLWTGDNWYTRETDFYSTWGLWYRPHRDRSLAVLQPLLKAMPHYASWDDHDYGPDNSSGSYILKDESRKVFMSYWANPSYGQNGEGVYTMVSYGDVDIFLCDDRWWRSADEVKDSVNGLPNPEKVMLGEKQMQWLKNSLLNSNATFKIIVMGSQVLNPVSTKDKFRDFSGEYFELMNFLEAYRLNGVLFFSGDRHLSEVIRVNRPGSYPLYDITISPLTSGTSRFSGAEINNPYRVFGLDEKQNFGRVGVSGAKGNRKLSVDFVGIKGEPLGNWSITQGELQTPKQ
jgi:alkaline phosphatase D